jgi:GntR family transcriptional regulator/MocR family aminotransferase
MPIQWAGLSPELILPLDRERSEPLRSQLEAGLREAIRSGRLQAGERLPSSRELARQLGVSPVWCRTATTSSTPRGT